MLRVYLWPAVFGVLFLFVCRTRLGELVDRWFSDQFSSVGLFIPFVSAALVWRRRRALASSQSRSFPGIVLILIAAAGASILPIGAVFFLYWVGVTFLLAGYKAVRTLIFPLALLFFVVPLPLSVVNVLDYPLQLGAASVTVRLAGLAGVHVIQQGPALTLPNTEIVIAAACNGLSSAAAMFLIGVVAAHLSSGPRWGRMLLPFAALLLAYVSNLVRLFCNVFVTNALGSSSLVSYETDYDLGIGLALFVLACVLLTRVIPLLKCHLQISSEA